MDITSWVDTWADIDWEKDSKRKLKKKILALYEAGVSFNMRNPADKDKRAPLHFAAEYCPKEIVELMIKCGANIALRAENNLTTLHYAARANKAENIKCFFDHGMVNLKDSWDQNALFYAVRGNNIEAVQTLCVCAPEMVNEKNKYGWRVLDVSNSFKYEETTKVLTEFNAKGKKDDVKVYTDTPLTLAYFEYGQRAEYDYPWMMNDSPLLSDDDNKYKKERDKNIRIMKRAKQKIKSLLKNGANPNVENRNGQPLLCYAAANCRDEMINVLLDHKDIDLTVTDNNNNTVLHCAVNGYLYGHDLRLRSFNPYLDRSSLSVIKKICDLKPDLINQQNNDGQTALHNAVANRDLDVVVELIKRGARVDIKDKWGRTPSDMLIKYMPLSLEIEEALLNAKQIRSNYLSSQDQMRMIVSHKKTKGKSAFDGRQYS